MCHLRVPQNKMVLLSVLNSHDFHMHQQLWFLVQCRSSALVLFHWLRTLFCCLYLVSCSADNQMSTFYCWVETNNCLTYPPPLAASCAFVKDVASYACFCIAAFLLLLQNEHMLCFIRDGEPSKICPFSVHLSYTWGQRNVFMHLASAYCNGYMLVAWVNCSIFVSFSAVNPPVPEVFRRLFTTW